MVQTNHRLIMSGLLEGWDWFDNGLQNVLREAGFRPLNKSQSMMVLYISAGVRRPIEIARKMRLSRQAIRHIANQLIDLDVIASRDDDGDGRSKILEFSEHATDLRTAAQATVDKLEALLRARLGREDFEILRRILRRDWGETVKGRADLGEGGASIRRREPPAKPAPKPPRAKRDKERRPAAR
jgi:DNA-binding MarR family transcriptional regulator